MVARAIFGIAKRGFGLLGRKSKSSPVINSVKPGKNLKKKRDVQDSVVKTKDKVMESLDTKGKLGQRARFAKTLKGFKKS